MSNLPAGALVDRVGRVPCMVVGEFAAAVGCFGTGFSTSMAAMIPFRLIGGIGGALAMAGSSAYTVDVTQKKHLRQHRGKIVGVQGGFIAIAYVIGPAVGGLLTDTYGASITYSVVGSLIACCGLAYGTLPETLHQTSARRTNSASFNHLRQVLDEGAKTWWELLQQPNQQALLAATVAVMLNYAALITVLPLQAFHTFGATMGEIGILYSVGSIIGIAVSPLAGKLADRFGRVPLMTPALVTCALGCFGTAIATEWTSFVAGYILWSVGEAVLSPLISAYAADIAPKEDTSAALTLSRQAGDLVFLLAPPALGMLYDISPGMAAMNSTAALTMLCGAIFHTCAREVKNPKTV